MRQRRGMQLATAAALVLSFTSAAFATRIVLRDGRMLSGKVARINATVENPQSQGSGQSIVLINDGLREIFVPLRFVQETSELDAGEPLEKFIIPQQICDNGMRIAGVGAIGRITPFDEHGRRILEMTTQRGKEMVLQGITEITPEWTKIECVETAQLHFTWDMRIATSMIPRDVLATVLSKQIDRKNIDQRLKIVRLYIQSQRFNDAEAELKEILADFPDEAKQYQPHTVMLRQAHARRILEEIDKRRAAGQHTLCQTLLNQFPAENVAGVTLQQVREMLGDYKRLEVRGKRAVARIDELIALIQDSALRARLAPVCDEIRNELSYNTLDRLAAFLQFEAEETMPPEDRVALAVSGWLIGSDYAVRNLPTSLSMFDSRALIKRYLVEPAVSERENILAELRKQEAFVPEYVAKIVAAMKPPVDTPAPPAPVIPEDGSAPSTAIGMYRLQCNGLSGEPPVDYIVQLPPEYDPNRRYPVIMTLHGAGSTPEMQVEWWAGPIGRDGYRYGHAGRNGYIVVAPQWAREQQLRFNYADYEYAAVLYVLRDVYRRFAVDTDRVFLTGHGMGGDAAWDLALAVPDLWAGFVTVNAAADKLTTFNWENAKYVPSYLVFGALDFERWLKNAPQMDRYLSSGEAGLCDSTIVRYIGRGQEHFADETIRLFDWMGRKTRDPLPRHFNCRSVSYFANSFWWAEIDDQPAAGMVDPDNFPPKGYVAMNVTGDLPIANSVRLMTGAAKATVWLSPELVDFKQPIDVYIRNRKINKNRFVEPDAAIILEDARARGDRQHPFWARVENER